MKARAVSYGALELKQMEHRYMAVGLTFSVAIHLCVIAAYILKGLVIHTPPPPANSGSAFFHPDPGIIDVIIPEFPPNIPYVRHGGSKDPGGKFVIPVPVPMAPSNDDSLLFKPGGDPAPSGDPGSGVESGSDGSGHFSGTIDAEKEPEPFLPVEKEPILIKKVDAAYPELAVRAGLEGKVWIKIWVDREGRAHKAVVIKSTGEIFNEAALKAAMEFVFVPAYMNGGPVSVWVSIPFTFRLSR